MHKVVAVLATMDTKGEEANFIRQQIEARGDKAWLVDMGVMEAPQTAVDVSTDEVAARGGSSLERLRATASRQVAAPVLVAGATAILQDKLHAHELHAVLALGGTQGTSNGSQVLQALPYGLPKIMVTTAASGDTSAFVGIKDITLMASVCDILGLHPFSRRILTNAAAAACGMAQVTDERVPTVGTKGVVAITNLGVLSKGTALAIDLLQRAGYEAITFHAIGSGGLAMEQMMKDGLITAVFDYALGEIADELFDGLRAAGPQRLTVAGSRGLPQVICPGGAEHIGLLLHEANVVPARYQDSAHVFHNPHIFAPRLRADELRRVARAITDRLRHVERNAVFMIPRRGVSRYSIAGAPLHDPVGDEAFFDALREHMPAAVRIRELDYAAEDFEFVRAAVHTLIELIENPPTANS